MRVPGFEPAKRGGAEERTNPLSSVMIPFYVSPKLLENDLWDRCWDERSKNDRVPNMMSIIRLDGRW